MRQPLKLLILPGDGVGPEVAAAAVQVLEVVSQRLELPLELTERPIGGASIDAAGVPVTEEVLSLANHVDAVFLGAVGGPRWDNVSAEKRPERGLLALRKAMGVFANLRPARCWPALVDASPLRRERVEGVDFLVVRELLGGIYFGQPRALDLDEGRGWNTMVYSRGEIERVARVAFEAARLRGGRVTSVDKANVLEVQRLWRRVVSELRDAEYPDVALEHQYVDSCAMRLLTHARELDVIVTGNMFGDIISDEAAALTGSLGMLPSASLGEAGRGLYEPVHGSAPDIEGQGVANPLASILSVAMLFEHSLKEVDAARAIEGAVEAALADGLRTADIDDGATTNQRVGTAAMTAAVVKHLNTHLKPR